MATGDRTNEGLPANGVVARGSFSGEDEGVGMTEGT